MFPRVVGCKYFIGPLMMVGLMACLSACSNEPLASRLIAESVAKKTAELSSEFTLHGIELECFKYERSRWPKDFQEMIDFHPQSLRCRTLSDGSDLFRMKNFWLRFPTTIIQPISVDEALIVFKEQMINGNLEALPQVIRVNYKIDYRAQIQNSRKGAKGKVESKVKGLQVTRAWLRATPPTSKMTAAYFLLQNFSEKPYTLTSVSNKSFQHSSIHQSLKVNGVSKMKALDGLVIPAGGSVEFKPGSYHIMLMGKQRDMGTGENTTLLFKFKEGLILEVDAKVKR